MTAPQRPTPAPFAWADEFFTVGVTGTNGKTSTTRMLGSILCAAGKRTLTETTLGYRLDDRDLEVQRTMAGFVEAFRIAHEAGGRDAVVEVTSEALAQGFAKKWRFDLGVFTNLSRDHLDAHGSWEHYLASKAQLFVHLGAGCTAVLNAADETSLLIDQVTPVDVKRLWYASPTRGALLHDADLQATAVSLSADGTHVTLAASPASEALGSELRVSLVGQVFAENALAAAGAALARGIAPEAVRRGLAELQPIPGRFQVLARRPLVVVDFAHTPDALARTCDSARELSAGGRLLVVFGAGGDRDPDKRGPMGRAVGERADVAIVTNDNPRHEDPKQIAKAVAGGCRKGGRAYVRQELDRERAIAAAIGDARESDVVLIAGKGHETGQTIGDRTLPFSDIDVVRKVLGA